MAVAALALCVAAFLSLSIGSTGITLAALPRVLGGLATGHADAATAREQLVLIDIRLPRLLLGAFVGAALAVAGAMMQGMFRNPLADPGLIGVSSGAALAAVATIALGNSLAAPWIKAFGVYALPVCGLLRRHRHHRRLVGIVGAPGPAGDQHAAAGRHRARRARTALTGLIAFASDDRELRDLTLWMLGSLSGASWPKVLAVLPFALLVAARRCRG